MSEAATQHIMQLSCRQHRSRALALWPPCTKACQCSTTPCSTHVVEHTQCSSVCIHQDNCAQRVGEVRLAGCEAYGLGRGWAAAGAFHCMVCCTAHTDLPMQSFPSVLLQTRSTSVPCSHWDMTLVTVNPTSLSRITSNHRVAVTCLQHGQKACRSAS
jgi:hypothetical protein